MKYKKLLLMMISVLMFTGCTLEYDLTINSKSMVEEVKLIYPNTEENKQIIKKLASDPPEAYFDNNRNESNYYETIQSQDLNNLYLTYKYKYTGSNLQHSKAINNCYYKKNVIENDELIILETDEVFRCLYDDYSKQIDNATIKIHTDYKVDKHNADEVKGTTYIWKIDESNYRNKPIHMKIDKKNRSINSLALEVIKIISIIGIPLLVICIIVSIIKIKGNKANKI